MILNVNAEAIGVSSATESAIGAEVAAVSAAVGAALTTVLPMGADLDSVQFAAALNAAGAAYLGVAGEHVASRMEFATAQGLAAATYAASDVISNTSLVL